MSIHDDKNDSMPPSVTVILILFVSMIVVITTAALCDKSRNNAIRDTEIKYGLAHYEVDPITGRTQYVATGKPIDLATTLEK